MDGLSALLRSDSVAVAIPLALIGSARPRDSRGYVDRLHRPGIPDNDV
jgi:hypothetical protein